MGIIFNRIVKYPIYIKFIRPFIPIQFVGNINVRAKGVDERQCG